MELTLEEAARRLGHSTEAVRKRAARGSLASRHDGRRLVIILPDDTPPADARPDGDRPSDADDRTRPDASPALVATLQQTIDLLTAQIREKDEQLRRAQEGEAEQRRIIAGLMQRLPELASPVDVATTPAPPAPPSLHHEMMDDAPDAPGASLPAPPPATPAELSQPQPWWRRWFGR